MFFLVCSVGLGAGEEGIVVVEFWERLGRAVESGSEDLGLARRYYFRKVVCDSRRGRSISFGEDRSGFGFVRDSLYLRGGRKFFFGSRGF